MNETNRIRPNTYWDYIQLDTLLSLQRPKTDYPDEKVFILYHQITELVFQLMLNELEQVVGMSLAKQGGQIKIKFQRLNEYTRLLIDSFEIMRKGMDFHDYNNFRKVLSPASGFQSVQFRRIELHCTSLYNLTSRSFKSSHLVPSDVSPEECFQNMYWQEAFAQGNEEKKSDTLELFENKYLDILMNEAKMLQQVNVYEQIVREQELPVDLVKALKKFDHFFNVKWPLTHYKTASHYLNSPETKAGTGGSDWGKYLLPQNQKRVFFPDLWSQDEMENWGKEGEDEK